MPEYSDLEKAIGTLVSQFHSASSDGSPVLKTSEFKNLLSAQLPKMASMGGDDVLQKMGVADGEGVSFSDFWTLIQSLATSQHSILSGQGGSSCSCILL